MNFLINKLYLLFAAFLYLLIQKIIYTMKQDNFKNIMQKAL